MVKKQLKPMFKTFGSTWEWDELLYTVKLAIGSALLYWLPGICLTPQDADWTCDLWQKLLGQRPAAVAHKVQKHLCSTWLHNQKDSLISSPSTKTTFACGRLCKKPISPPQHE